MAWGFFFLVVLYVCGWAMDRWTADALSRDAGEKRCASTFALHYICATLRRWQQGIFVRRVKRSRAAPEYLAA